MKILLLDGNSLTYRAFFALISRPLRTTRGENTSAAWGVVNFLLRLREKYRPEYLAWVHDAGDSFRTALYPEYKSTREKLDDELQAEFDRSVVRIEQLLRAFRVPVVAVPGYEADDVIGTMARLGVDQGWQVVVVSGDKDFYQLIGPRVALLNPGRGGPGAVDELWVDEANAADRLGVPPAQVVDYLALVGDASDNVPGVKGIGSKGAVELLAQFGSLEAMLGRAGEVKGKRAREALEQIKATGTVLGGKAKGVERVGHEGPVGAAVLGFDLGEGHDLIGLGPAPRAARRIGIERRIAVMAAVGHGRADGITIP